MIPTETRTAEEYARHSNVNPPLARFHARDPGLTNAHLFSQIDLPQARFLPQ
jgi:hypothetical protein